MGLLHHMSYMVFDGSSSGPGGLGGDAVPDSNAQQRGMLIYIYFN